jgi:RNA polymerase sigma factor (sigma-70 family)
VSVAVRRIQDPLLARSALQRQQAKVATDLDGLFREHRSGLMSLAAAITLDRSMAEEVVQDAFLGLQRHYGHVENPVGYLHRSVVLRSISLLRRRKTASRYAAPLATVTTTPEIDETWTSVTRLPPRERAVVVLRYWHDMSEADIATTLGWPKGTVKSTLSRALKRLRKDIER